MSDFPLLSKHACSNPTRPVESQRIVRRGIQPIDVIERWALCHHLGCVVKYLAQAGGKNPSLKQTRLEQTHLEQNHLKNLKKAEWYLQRELDRSQQCPFAPMGAQPFTTEAVLDDWGLSFHLSETLYHIKASKSPSMREESLRQALKHLQAEIAIYDQEASGPNNQEEGETRK